VHDYRTSGKLPQLPAARVCRLLGLLLLLAGATASAQEVSETCRVEALQRLEAEIRRLESQATDAQVLTGLAHTHFFLGNVTPDRSSALTHYQFGLSFANQALKLQKNNPAARLWGVVSTLKIFAITKPMRALWTMDDLEATLLELKAADEKFLHAAPDRVLAVLYSESPGFLVGSSTKAQQHFEAALRVVPEFPANTLLYADFMLNQDRADDARTLISNWTTRDKMHDFPLYEKIWCMDLEKIRQRLAE
jgi:hypothetical protein